MLEVFHVINKFKALIYLKMPCGWKVCVNSINLLSSVTPEAALHSERTLSPISREELAGKKSSPSSKATLLLPVEEGCFIPSLLLAPLMWASPLHS